MNTILLHRGKRKKATKENSSFDLENELEKLNGEINRIFKFQFSAIFNISEEITDEDEDENEIVLKRIRSVALHFTRNRIHSLALKYGPNLLI